MKREFIDYAHDILDSIEKIEQFTSGMSFETFSSDDKTVIATVRALEIIGEAASKLPVEIRSHYSDISWREVIGIRNKLIHEYFGVNIKIIWETITEDLPKLKPVIMQVLEETK